MPSFESVRFVHLFYRRKWTITFVAGWVMATLYFYSHKRDRRQIIEDAIDYLGETGRVSTAAMSKAITIFENETKMLHTHAKDLKPFITDDQCDLLEAILGPNDALVKKVKSIKA